MEYKRKTRDEFEIQTYYDGCGWECVTTEETRKDAVEMLKCYRENEPMYSHRLVKKRVRIA